MESRAGQALDFLVRFLNEALLPNLDDHAGREFPWHLLKEINEGLESIHVYGTERRKRLRGTLKPMAHQRDHRFSRSRANKRLYHQQTKNLLVSYSPKALGFF
ncbi:hypothetical protein MUU72_00510 [Streptomyces sp. RS10V-4]|uniref:hypothetical protein n=1 Tax=Streptomyces rhizoryzae TaxID=2932493 RepID=UPI002005189E|nr:hypothetical protein [Streptomyces rhizoryzae]MCK7621629.1 hypothetical protein [Streptomyces rhizoryzae]